MSKKNLMNMHVHNARDFPQAKPESKIKLMFNDFLLNEHGDYIFYYPILVH